MTDMLYWHAPLQSLMVTVVSILVCIAAARDHCWVLPALCFWCVLLLFGLDRLTGEWILRRVAPGDTIRDRDCATPRVAALAVDGLDLDARGSRIYGYATCRPARGARSRCASPARRATRCQTRMRSRRRGGPRRRGRLLQADACPAGRAPRAGGRRHGPSGGGAEGHVALGFVGRDAAPAPPREAVGAPVDVGAAAPGPEPRGLRGRAPHAVGDGHRPSVTPPGRVQHLASGRSPSSRRRRRRVAAGVM